MQLSCGVVPLSGTGGGSAVWPSAGAFCARPAAAKPMAIATVNASNLDVDVTLMAQPFPGNARYASQDFTATANLSCAHASHRCAIGRMIGCPRSSARQTRLDSL